MESVAAILLVLGIIALLSNYVAGGWPRVGEWLNAKFIGSG